MELNRILHNQKLQTPIIASLIPINNTSSIERLGFLALMELADIGPSKQTSKLTRKT